MECSKCKKVFKELWSFGPFSGLQNYYIKNLWYCDECFDKIKQKEKVK